MPTVSASQSPPPPLVSARLLPGQQGPGYMPPGPRASPAEQLILRCAALRLGDCTAGWSPPAARAGGAAGAGGAGRRLRLKVGAPRPRDVRTVFQPAEDPRATDQRGEGHRFGTCCLHTWCDLCGGAIAPGRPSVRCSNCNYTAHEVCRNFIKLDCQQGEQLSEEKFTVEVEMVLPESEAGQAKSAEQ
ncbi:ras association domain-containing protein 5-like [Narcine bancroftii]|uniref:ras association domain-containing protein 5-like n=1 Tax=Narcine bancroftii TaxID=1343680 RepID=UPI003831F7B1